MEKKKQSGTRGRLAVMAAIKVSYVVVTHIWKHVGSMSRCDKYKLLRTAHNHYITHTLFHLLRSIPKHVVLVDAVDHADDADDGVVYLITFCHHVDDMPKHYIVYQLEQMHTDNYLRNEPYKHKLRNAQQCWDYNAHNFRFYTTSMPRAWLPVPIASMPDIFASERPRDQPPIDVLFYGAVNDRRYEIMKRLHSALRPYALTVKLVRGFYGDALYPFIRRARVVLNLGFYDDTLLATYRLNEALAHHRVVVTEWTAHASDRHTIEEYKRGGVIFIPPIEKALGNMEEALIAPLMKLLTDPSCYVQHQCQGRRFVAEKEVFFRERLASLLRQRGGGRTRMRV